MTLHLDTHAALWVYTGEIKKFSQPTFKLMNQSDDLYISPAVLLELSFLYEIHRIKTTEDKIFKALQNEFQIKISPLDSAELFKKACDLSWTRDPFDRLIVASAAVCKAHLITKDRHIHDNYSQCLW